MEDRRRQVLRQNAAVLGISAVLVGRAMDDATLHPATRQRHGKDVSPVVAATGRVHAGRPAELRHAHDQRFVEHAALVKVFQKSGVRLVHRRREDFLQALGFFDVTVPTRIVRRFVRAPKPVDLHQRDARFNEPP